MKVTEEAIEISFFDLSEEAIRRQPKRVITYDQMIDLAQSMQALRWLPEQIRMTGLRTSLQAISPVTGRRYAAPARGLTYYKV